jgi:Restriction endonuclease
MNRKNPLEKPPETLAGNAVDVLRDQAVPLQPREISRLLDSLGKGSQASASDRVGVVTRALHDAVEDPQIFTPLVCEPDGAYRLARPEKWEPVGLTNEDFFGMNDEHGQRLSPTAEEAVLEARREQLEQDVPLTMEAVVGWLRHEGLLTGELRLSRLLNLAWQRGQLDALLATHQKLSLKELLPHLRRALLKHERDNYTGSPLFVWSDDDNFQTFNEAPAQAHIQSLLAQDELTFRATVQDLLEGWGARHIHEVKGGQTVMFRAELRGRSVAVRAVNTCIPVEREDIQQLRGALDAGEEGLFLSLGTMTHEARAESQRAGVAHVELTAGPDLLMATALAAAMAPTS